MKQKILYWLPLFILPICNILITLIVKQPIVPALPYIMGAVAEELFFRWFLLKHLLLPRMKPIIAILLISVLFASIHLFNLRAGQPLDLTLVQVFSAFCFSIWAGAVVWKSTWLIPLIAHVLMNATAGEEVMWVSLAVSAVVLADGILLMKGEQYNSINQP